MEMCSMTMMMSSGLTAPNGVAQDPRKLDLPAEIRVGEAAHPARITTLSATGVELDVNDEPQAEAMLVDDIILVIPSLGQYKARRLRRNGARAAYLFELTEFSRRALGALIADRFPD
jgi:hypothetical protein